MFLSVRGLQSVRRSIENKGGLAAVMPAAYIFVPALERAARAAGCLYPRVHTTRQNTVTNYGNTPITCRWHVICKISPIRHTRVTVHHYVVTVVTDIRMPDVAHKYQHTAVTHYYTKLLLGLDAA